MNIKTQLTYVQIDNNIFRCLNVVQRSFYNNSFYKEERVFYPSNFLFSQKECCPSPTFYSSCPCRDLNPQHPDIKWSRCIWAPCSSYYAFPRSNSYIINTYPRKVHPTASCFCKTLQSASILLDSFHTTGQPEPIYGPLSCPSLRRGVSSGPIRWGLPS